MAEQEQDTTLSVFNFQGLSNDKGKKFLNPDEFSDILNFNYDDITGANTIQYPTIILNAGTSDNIDGIYEFRYLDQYNVLQLEKICVYGGTIYKNWDSTPTALKTGLTAGKCCFRVYQDKLYITNGKNYPQYYDGYAVSEMGAPRAVNSNQNGNLTGVYIYEMTYVDAGGEKRLNTKSTAITASSNKIDLYCPLGWTGVTSRKIYRTEAGGSIFKLVTTLNDNTTTTYTDNIQDGSLTTDIIGINKEMIKPYFIEVNQQKLVAGKIDKYPTQIHVSEANTEVIDTSAYVNLSNISGDNTPVSGLLNDYDKILAGTQKTIYIMDVSGTTTSTTPTRSKVGVKSGYTMAQLPAEGEFQGGVMFVSTLDDIRVFSGNFAQPIATSLDNLVTPNFSLKIQNTLKPELKNTTQLHAEFYDYKYHLAVSNYIYILEIRGLKWSKYEIKTSSYRSIVNCFGIIGESLYIGQKDSSIIEKMYSSNTYRSEEVTARLKLAQLFGIEKGLKFFPGLKIFQIPGAENEYTVKITIEDKYSQTKTIEVNEKLGAFDNQFFNDDTFKVGENAEDYRLVNINELGRWIDIEIQATKPFYFRGYSIKPDYVKSA